MARILEPLVLKHRANTGEDVEEVTFEEGEEVTILATWESAYLIKNQAGQLFNIAKEQVE